MNPVTQTRHSITSILVGIAAIVLVIIAILMHLARDSIKGISGYSNNANLQDIEGRLNTAIVLAWVAAGIAVLLALGYLVTGLGSFENSNEWIHLILWLLLFGTLIASLIMLGMVISDLDNLNLSSDAEANSALSYMWWAMGLGIAAALFLFFSGAWRVYGAATESNCTVKKTQTKYRVAPTTHIHTVPTTTHGYHTAPVGSPVSSPHYNNNYQFTTNNSALHKEIPSDVL